MKLKRTVQCAKCPWKVSTDPNKIPGGYSKGKHEALKCTIAHNGRSYRAMACHESKPGQEYHCVGWLYNQLGVGNNIQLRLQMLSCENISQLRVVGDQHKSFKDTLPKH